MNDYRRVLIPASITGPGMFPGEVALTINTGEGPVTLLADKGLLRDEGTAIIATRIATDKAVTVCLLPVREVDSPWVRIATTAIRELQPA